MVLDWSRKGCGRIGERMFVGNWREAERVERREGSGNRRPVVGRSAADKPVVDKLFAVDNSLCSRSGVEFGRTDRGRSYSFLLGVVR